MPSVESGTLLIKVSQPPHVANAFALFVVDCVKKPLQWRVSTVESLYCVECKMLVGVQEGT